MVSIPVSPYCELARWTLDRIRIPYREDAHAPVFHLLATRRHGGGSAVPVLDTGEASLPDARQVIYYYERRTPQGQRLYPANPEQQSDAQRLFKAFFDHLGVAVRAWAYAYLLPRRETTSRLWVHNVPRLERALVPAAYPLLAMLVRRDLDLRTDTIPEQWAVIETFLDRVEERLADERPYLLGSFLTVADVAFAALTAPLVLPPEYGGPMPTLEDLPDTMRKEVEQARERRAGRFVLQLYREERRREL
ncbi:MAG: glutathione S-transferase C-terminal domain-containing protein [Actinobacteria bacterium]|nr:glutathione S-transferase C-terminal domain-containing protein [Actinomycetota bacterium]